MQLRSGRHTGARSTRAQVARGGSEGGGGYVHAAATAKEGTVISKSGSTLIVHDAFSGQSVEPWCIVDVEKDNSCFYHAIARQLVPPHHTPASGRVNDFRAARNVHANITRWVLQNWDSPVHGADTTLTVGNLAALSHYSLDDDSDVLRATYELQYSQFARDIAIDGIDSEDMPWGGAVEQYAAAQLYRRCVEVYSQQRVRRSKKKGRRSRTVHIALYQCFTPIYDDKISPIRLLYCERNAHYKSIEIKKQ